MAKFHAEHLLCQYQGNVYPAMYDDLAADLGVTADSLRKLALGWAPIVEFKKNKSSIGWWVIPERDEHAEVVGLALRNQGGSKFTYPGSKHGVVYEVNPSHAAGEKGFSPGPHNWVRTMDAGINCPVCGKPDGCLLSSENPTNPKAVVCRVKPSDKQLKFGYLHVLKEEGNLTGRSALIDNGGPVIVVEGMSDTAAAMDLGFNAVGRPSNLAGLSVTAELVRGRAVIIVGENDRKADGKEPGKEGLIAAFQTIKRVCSDVTMVMPPDHIKDLRVWKNKYGLKRDVFLAYVAEKGEKKTSHLVINDNRPTTVARAFLGEEYRLAGRYTLRYWQDTWYEYIDGVGKYSSRVENLIIRPLYQWAYDKMVQFVNPKTGEVTLSDMSANPAFRAGVFEAIVAETLVENQNNPCWINGKSGPNPADLVVFNNGILNVTAFLDGRPEAEYLIDHTPDLFTTAALPIPFDPMALCPHWKRFLRTSLGDEQAKILLLQEWIGYCMTSDTSMQKMMFLRGPTAAGKSRALEVIEALVGKEQTAWTSLKEISGAFGVAPLMGKLVCLIGDARTPKHWDAVSGLEILLNITGNDSVSVNRKFRDQLAGQRLMTRITIASNEFLEVPDHAGAMARRLNVIDFTQTFKDNPDTTLPAKLLSELPGIAVWALAGLRRLRTNKTFTVPLSSQIAMQEWRSTTSPIAAFIEECCDQVSGSEVDKTLMFDAWSGWSNERRMSPIGKSRFFERLKTNAPFVSSDTYEKGGHKFSVFKGIQLKSWAAKQFTGRPA